MQIEVSALVHVSGTQGEDFGHQTVTYPVYDPSLTGTPGPSGGQQPIIDPGDDPSTQGAFQVPDNFWGFVMLMMGLK